MRFYALDGHGAFLTKNQEPSRAKSGDDLNIPYAKGRQASPAKPWTGTHRGNGGEENHVRNGKEL